jgi:hypothetical protein
MLFFDAGHVFCFFGFLHVIANQQETAEEAYDRDAKGNLLSIELEKKW